MIELDPAVRTRVAEMLGPDVGAGIPQATAHHAALWYAISVPLPLIGPLLVLAFQLVVRVAIEPWYLPWIVRLGARGEGEGWEAATLTALAVRTERVQRSAFARFHRSQAIRLGATLLVVGVLTLGLGLVLGALPYVILVWISWSRARRGQWYRAPVVGPAVPLDRESD